MGRGGGGLWLLSGTKGCDLSMSRFRSSTSDFDRLCCNVVFVVDLKCSV